MELMQHRKWRWKILSAWIAIFTVAVLWNNYQNRQLISENKQRIQDIQASRAASCRRTYRVIQEILQASTKGVKLTDGRKERYDRLLKLADPNRCLQQTNPDNKTKTRSISTPTSTSG